MIFAVIPVNKVQKILEIFNNYHSRIKFTVELERNGSINFLDTSIIRNEDKLIIN